MSGFSVIDSLGGLKTNINLAAKGDMGIPGIDGLDGDNEILITVPDTSRFARLDRINIFTLINYFSSLQAIGPINMENYTVATLPIGTQGDIAYVTDALLPTFLAVIAGGGAVVTPVFFNGVNWVGF